MFNFKSFFKPALADIARNELYRAERALLSAKINKSFCESEITYNTARIEHLQAVISGEQLPAFNSTTAYPELDTRHFPK